MQTPTQLSELPSENCVGMPRETVAHVVPVLRGRLLPTHRRRDLIGLHTHGRTIQPTLVLSIECGCLLGVLNIDEQSGCHLQRHEERK